LLLWKRGMSIYDFLPWKERASFVFEQKKGVD